MIDKLSWMTIYPEVVLLVMTCIIALVDLSTTGARRTRTYILSLLTLAVDDRRFALVGDAWTARAPDATTDRAIVAAMRGARGMTLSTLDRAGRPLADGYALAGAATAIDAAALACARG